MQNKLEIMGVVRKVFGVVIICLFSYTTSFAQVQLDTQIDTTQGYIGDLFNLQIVLEHPRGFTVEYPDDIQKLGEFDVRDIHERIKQTHTTLEYTLAVYDTGKYSIPPIEVSVQPQDTTQSPLKFSSDEITVQILSMVPADAQELKDIKPLMNLPQTFPWFWIALIFVLLFAGYFLWRYLTNRKPVTGAQMSPEERRRSAHERAFEELDRIRAANYPELGAMKQHFSEISQTVRRYFEDRYFIPALEMTTTEVMQNLPTEHIEYDIEQQIQNLLSVSDLVKFAKYRASIKEAEQIMNDAYNIVEDTMFMSYEDKNEQENLIISENQGESP